MVRLKAPALSLEASGSLGGALVFSKWKGRPYARTLVTPANPKSGGQVGMRSMLKWLSQAWDALSDADKATWLDRAGQSVISTFNAYVSLNQFRWRDFLAPSTADPPTTADTPATLGAFSLTLGVRSITCSQAVTTAADGWGVLFFRSPTGTFSTAFDNLIGVGLIVGTAAVVHVDSPLVPGDYYYDTREFTLDGQMSAETGEETETVV